VKLFLAAVLCTLFCLPLAAEEAKALTDISEAKTACLVNRGTDLGVVDEVRDRLKKWGRWKLVPRPEEADLLLVLSEQQMSGSISTATGAASGYGHYAAGSSMGLAVPILMRKVFLTVVDRRADTPLTFVSSDRAHIFKQTSAWLVDKLKDQMDKHEHRDESRPASWQ
jgi:hypothetical protein